MPERYPDALPVDKLILARQIMERALEHCESIGVIVKLRGVILRKDRMTYERPVGREERRIR